MKCKVDLQKLISIKIYTAFPCCISCNYIHGWPRYKYTLCIAVFNKIHKAKIMNMEGCYSYMKILMTMDGQ